MLQLALRPIEVGLLTFIAVFGVLVTGLILWWIYKEHRDLNRKVKEWQGSQLKAILDEERKETIRDAFGMRERP